MWGKLRSGPRREGARVVSKAKPLDARTLRWAARKAETEAQLTYDSRDELPAELTARWKELDQMAGSLSSFAGYLLTEARAIKRKAKTKP